MCWTGDGWCKLATGTLSGSFPGDGGLPVSQACMGERWDNRAAEDDNQQIQRESDVY